MKNQIRQAMDLGSPNGTTDTLKIISISDVHNGVSRIPEEVIPTNFRKHVFPYLTDELDLFILAGDFSDGLMEFGGTSSWHAMQLIDDLIDLAIQHKFYIRILQGTFTHDRLQSRMFKYRTHKLAPLNGSDLIKFVDTIDIEHIESLGITLLYKPDNIKDPWNRIQKLVKEVGCPIDIFVNHGYFTHLLPKGLRHELTNVLDAKKVQTIVQGFTVTGHDHTSCIYDRVINNGSFDRLVHGQEEAKGFFYLTYDRKEHVVHHTFIENTSATLFKTIDLRGLDDLDLCKQKALELTTHWVTTCQSTCPTLFIRIIHSDDVIRTACMSLLSGRYNHLTLTGDRCEKEKQEDKPIEVFESVDFPEITPINLVDMLYEYAQQHNLSLTKPYLQKKLS